MENLVPLGFFASRVVRALQESKNKNKLDDGVDSLTINASSEVETQTQISPQPTVQSPTDHPFILISSSGNSASYYSHMFGLYEKMTWMTEAPIVYEQENSTILPRLWTDYGLYRCKLLSDQGVWSITYNGSMRLRAIAQSENPTSVKWQYYNSDNDTWQDGPELTVTGLSEKPNEITNQSDSESESE